MKKLIAMLLALVMILALAACKPADDASEPATDSTDGLLDDNATESPEQDLEEPSEGAEEPAAVMTHEEFVAAEMDSAVTVETYVQAVESWWDGCVQLYTQAEDGAYYIYNLACTEEEAAEFVPGTKIRVSGYKAEWSGEVEIIDATYEILEGSYIVEEAADVTALMGTEELADHMNELVAVKGLTVAASKDAEGNEVPFLYKWDGSGAQGDDIYFNVTLGETTYTFTVNAYMIGTGADSDVYKAVEALQIGDKIDIEGFLYWYDAAQPHVTAVTPAA